MTIRLSPRATPSGLDTRAISCGRLVNIAQQLLGTATMRWLSWGGRPGDAAGLMPAGGRSTAASMKALDPVTMTVGCPQPIGDRGRTRITGGVQPSCRAKATCGTGGSSSRLVPALRRCGVRHEPERPDVAAGGSRGPLLAQHPRGTEALRADLSTEASRARPDAERRASTWRRPPLEPLTSRDIEAAERLPSSTDRALHRGRPRALHEGADGARSG